MVGFWRAELGTDTELGQLSPENGRNWSHLKLKSPAKAQLEHESRKVAGKIGQQETLFQPFHNSVLFPSAAWTAYCRNLRVLSEACNDAFIHQPTTHEGTSSQYDGSQTHCYSDHIDLVNFFYYYLQGISWQDPLQTTLSSSIQNILRATIFS